MVLMDPTASQRPSLWKFARTVLFAAALACIGTASALAQDESAQQSGETRDIQFWEELAFWDSVKNSDNPEELQAYIDSYPDGRFVALAKVRIRSLEASQAAESAAPAPEPAGTAPAPDTELVIDRNTETATPPSPGTSDTTAAQPLTAKPATVLTNSNVRAAPSTNAQRISGVEKDATVLVIGAVADGSWYRVQLHDGQIGYIYQPLLQLTGDAGAESTASTSSLPAAGELFRDCEQCPVVTVIAGGEFEMGSDERSNETPRHRVSIANAFVMGIFEVRVGEWLECVNANACQYDPRRDGATEPDLPISNISWNDAQEYLTWLTQLTGQPYRLPTEAEWEYSARAGTTSHYWWGDQVGQSRANCTDCGSQWDGREPAPVGSFAANPFGLYDVHGNVWEWTEDCYQRSYANTPTDGSAQGPANCLSRVLRGGSWKSNSTYMRSARRNQYDLDVRYFLNGFRLARDL